MPSVQYNNASDHFTITSTIVSGNEPFTGGLATFTITQQNVQGPRVISYSMPFTNDVATFNSNLTGISVTQDNSTNTLFDLIQGTYVITCHASFSGLYREVDQDETTSIYSDARYAPFNLQFLDNSSTGYNIIYKSSKPTIQINFPNDRVYGGAFTFSVNTVNTYTMELGNNVNSASSVYTFQIPDDLVVGTYTISTSFSSFPNFSSVSNNTIYLVVDKATLHVNALPNYSITESFSSVTISGTIDTVLTDSSVVIIIANTNEQFVVESTNGTFIKTINGLRTIYDAGTYEIIVYCTGNANYNKSDLVYTHLVVQKQPSIDSTVTVGTLDENYNYPITVSGVVSGDTVYIYTKYTQSPLIVFTPDITTYLIPDSLFQTGNNVIYAIISGINHVGKSANLTIVKPEVPVNIVLTVDNSTLKYLETVTLTATISCDRIDVMQTINEGYVVFSVNGSVISSSSYPMFIAVYYNTVQFYINLLDMGENIITAQFVESIQYLNSSSNSVTVTVNKTDLTVALIDTTINLNNVMDKKVLVLQVGNAIYGATDTPYNNINTGLVTFKVNGINTCDNVAVTNGLAKFNFYIEDNTSYTIQAIFNGNENYNNITSNTITVVPVVTKNISTVYSSITRDITSKISDGYLYVSATVVTDLGEDHLNSGVVTFTFEGVTRDIPLMNGKAATLFVANNNTDIPTITYHNPAFTGTLTDVSGVFFTDILGMTVTIDNIYYAKDNSHQILKTTIDGSSTSVFAGNGINGNINGVALQSSFSRIFALTVDTNGSIYVADEYNSSVRKISSGIVSTFAGPGLVHPFQYLTGIASGTDNSIYVSDYGNNNIRKILQNGTVTLVAGDININSGYVDGPGASARFSRPLDIVMDSSNNVYVLDGNNVIRKITPDGLVSTIAGIANTSGYQDGDSSISLMNGMTSITVDKNGIVYIADTGNNCIRKINGNVVSTLIGSLFGISNLKINLTNTFLYFTIGLSISKINLSTLSITRVN